MKKSLIGGLSALALVITGLAACAPTTITSTSNPDITDTDENTVPTVTIANINEIGDEGFKSALHGEEVYLESVEVAAAYEHVMFVHQLGKDVTLEQVALEIHSQDNLSSYGLSAIVNIQGIVSLEGKRIILDDCYVEEVKPSKGEPNNIAMVPADRSMLTQATRYFNGIIGIGKFQAAQEIPTFTTTEEKSFKVAFPGEDLDLENVNNPFLLDFVVPAGIDQATIDLLNSYRFKDVEVGDCFSSIVMLQYTENPLSRWKLILNPGFASNEDYKGSIERTPAIYKDYDSLYNDFIAPQFGDEALSFFPSLEAKDADGKNLIFSYVGNNSMFTKENNNTVLIDVTSYKSQDAYKALVNSIKAEGKLVDGGDLTDPGSGTPYHAFASDETANPALSVMIFDFYKSFVIQISTSDPRPVQVSQVFDTYAEAAAAFNAGVNKTALKYDFLTRQTKAFETKLPDLTSAIEAGGYYNVKNYEFNRTFETVYLDLNFPVMHEELRYNLDVPENLMPKLKLAGADDYPIFNVEGVLMTYEIPEELIGVTPDSAESLEPETKIEFMYGNVMLELAKAQYAPKYNNHLIDSEGNGMFCFHSEETNEALDFWLRTPTPKILLDTNDEPLTDADGNYKVSATEWTGNYHVVFAVDVMASFFKDFTPLRGE